MLPYPTKRGDENLFVVAFDAFSIIKEKVQNPTLWFLKKLAMPPKSRWKKYVPIHDCDSGMFDLSELMSGSAYSDAYNKFVVGPDKNDQLFVPFVAWIDETGLTKNMRHPYQPFLINCLLPKRECQRNRLLAYVPCISKSSAKKKRSAKNFNEVTPLQQYHSAMKVIFRMFDGAASEFKKKKITVTLGGTVKKGIIVPVLLYMKGDHKIHPANICSFGHTNGVICISCNGAAAWDADNAEIAIGEQINATELHIQNVEYSNITDQIDLLREFTSLYCYIIKINNSYVLPFKIESN